MDASVAHQRRIRNLFSELETKNKTREEMDSEEEDEVHPAVQVNLAWLPRHDPAVIGIELDASIRDIHRREGWRAGGAVTTDVPQPVPVGIRHC